MTDPAGIPAFSGCVYMAKEGDRTVAAAVPFRLRPAQDGSWRLALIGDDGGEMVFEAPDGYLKCARFTLRVDGVDLADDVV